MNSISTIASFVIYVMTTITLVLAWAAANLWLATSIASMLGLL